MIGEWFYHAEKPDERWCYREATATDVGLSRTADGPVTLRLSPLAFRDAYRPVLTTFTFAERDAMIRGMIGASNAFYAAAIRIGNHPFIEFAGLMNEYIKVATRAHAQGIDFTESSTHSGIPLPMQTYEAAYIGEKLGCIYGPSLSRPDLFRKFLESMGVVQPDGNAAIPPAIPST